MESQSELVGGEQNNQTVQPLVADENDQNVKSKADGKKKAKSPGTDKKCREKKKRKTEATEKQLEESGSKIDKLEKKNAYLNGKLDQAKEDIKLITGARHRVLIRPRETFPFEATRFGTGEIGLPVHSSPVHQIVLTIGLEGLADEDPWWTHLPFETTGFGTGEIGLPAHNPPVHQFGTTTGSGGLAVEHPRGLPQSQLSQGRTNVQQKNHDEYLKADRPLIGVFGDFGDYPNNISLPRAAMASGSSPMQGSLAPGGQPVAGRTGFGTLGPFDFHQPATGSTMELGGPDIQELLCPSHEVELAHRNNVEQPALSYDGLAQGGGLLGSHGLCYTSPPGAAMASGSSPMQGSLAPGGQAYLSFEVTGFGTGETGLPSHHPPVHQCGTTMGSGGLAVEDSPGLPQLELSQEWMHLPSFGIGDQESTSSIENLSMPSTPILENLSMPSTPILKNLSMSSTPILENLSLPSTSFLENLSMSSTPILENLSMPSTPILENLPMLSTSFLENDWIEDQYNAPTRMP